MYPFNVINWFKMVLLSGAMSISLGAVFLGIRWRYWDSNWPSDPIFEQVIKRNKRDIEIQSAMKNNVHFQDNINDRLGFHHVFMSVGIWPMIMALITDEWRNKRPVTRDVEDRLYSKAAYIFTKVKARRRTMGTGMQHISSLCSLSTAFPPAAVSSSPTQYRATFSLGFTTTRSSQETLTSSTSTLVNNQSGIKLMSVLTFFQFRLHDLLPLHPSHHFSLVHIPV
jgi:hypothetical protein